MMNRLAENTNTTGQQIRQGVLESQSDHNLPSIPLCHTNTFLPPLLWVFEDHEELIMVSFTNKAQHQLPIHNSADVPQF